MTYRFAQPRQHGFTLIHMLAGLIMLVVFMGVASQLFVSTFRVQRDTVTAQRTSLLAQQMLGQLRRDAWISVEVEVSDGELQLISPAGEPIVYRYRDTGELVRIAGQTERTIAPADLPRIEFTTTTSGIRLRTQDRTLVLSRPASFAWNTEPRP